MLITNAFRLGDFFVIFFFVPKIVPKVCNSYAALVNKECCI